MTYYRKHRPQKISELDLQAVRGSLVSLASSLDDFPHAFLFSGPRGSGKTSAARIVSKLVNCEAPIKTKADDSTYLEPCNKCSQCLAIERGQSMDVIEMDAASNRGIDDIRDLRENIALAPASAKKKIYIMDEVHMLTTEAANAFLKTLEEPPEHVMFILATTNPEKLPETVISRLQLITFGKANFAEIERQLSRVAKSEGLTLEDGVVELLLRKSDGSFRDSVKLLESLSTVGKQISLKVAKEKLDNTSIIDFDLLIESIVEKRSEKVISILNNYAQAGGSAKDLLVRLIRHFQKVLLSINGAEEHETHEMQNEEVINLLDILLLAESKMSYSSFPVLPIQIGLAGWCSKPGEVVRIKKKKSSKVEKNSNKVNPNKVELDDVSWAKILTNVRAKNASIEALLRAAKPMGMDGDKFNLGVYYRFHKERLETSELKRTFEDVVSEVLGTGPIRLVCSLEEKMAAPISPQAGLPEVEDNDIIHAAKEIFGN